MGYFREIKTRVMWLSMGLALSLGIAQIIKGFEATLEKNIVLATFIPLVVYMSDAVGTQMEAMIIRQLNEKKKFAFVKFLRHQMSIVVTVAIIIGVISGVVVGLLERSEQLGMVIGLSLTFGILSSLLTGTLMPYMFWRMHDDPAEASGPIATVVQDMLSVVIFFLIAQALL
jgi:magnesium transporter